MLRLHAVCETVVWHSQYLCLTCLQFSCPNHRQLHPVHIGAEKRSLVSVTDVVCDCVVSHLLSKFVVFAGVFLPN